MKGDCWMLISSVFHRHAGSGDNCVAVAESHGLPWQKGDVGFADLTALRLTPLGRALDPLMISRMVGWRNYATTLVPTNKTFPIFHRHRRSL